MKRINPYHNITLYFEYHFNIIRVSIAIHVLLLGFLTRIVYAVVICPMHVTSGGNFAYLTVVTMTVFCEQHK